MCLDTFRKSVSAINFDPFEVNETNLGHYTPPPVSNRVNKKTANAIHQACISFYWQPANLQIDDYIHNFKKFKYTDILFNNENENLMITLFLSHTYPFLLYL